LIITKGLIDGGKARGDKDGSQKLLQTMEVDEQRASEARRMTADLRVVNVTWAPASSPDSIYPYSQVETGTLPPAIDMMVNSSQHSRSDFLGYWQGEK